MLDGRPRCRGRVAAGAAVHVRRARRAAGGASGLRGGWGRTDGRGTRSLPGQTPSGTVLRAGAGERGAKAVPLRG